MIHLGSQSIQLLELEPFHLIEISFLLSVSSDSAKDEIKTGQNQENKQSKAAVQIHNCRF